MYLSGWQLQSISEVIQSAEATGANVLLIDRKTLQDMIREINAHRSERLAQAIAGSKAAA